MFLSHTHAESRSYGKEGTKRCLKSSSSSGSEDSAMYIGPSESSAGQVRRLGQSTYTVTNTTNREWYIKVLVYYY